MREVHLHQMANQCRSWKTRSNHKFYSKHFVTLSSERNVSRTIRKYLHIFLPDRFGYRQIHGIDSMQGGLAVFRNIQQMQQGIYSIWTRVWKTDDQFRFRGSFKEAEDLLWTVVCSPRPPGDARVLEWCSNLSSETHITIAGQWTTWTSEEREHSRESAGRFHGFQNSHTLTTKPRVSRHLGVTAADDTDTLLPSLQSDCRLYAD